METIETIEEMGFIDNIFNKSWSMWISAALVCLCGIIIIKLVLFLGRKMLKKSRIDPALHAFILSSIKILMGVALLIAILSELGIDTKTFVAVLGAAGAAVALALKDSLANVAGGIIILLTNPFNKEDYIDIIDAEGTVEKIDIITTTLRTVDNKIVIIPNGTISNSILTNYTRAGERRVDCKFGVDYNSDLDKVRATLNQVAEECPYVFHDREYFIGVASHGESAVDIDFRVWCAVENYWNAKYYIEEHVKVAFDSAGIEIPFPQMDVKIKQ